MSSSLSGVRKQRMSRWVLDSSAVLAVVLRETGHEDVRRRFADSSISTVNLSEVLSKLAERDRLTKQDIEDFEKLEINIVEFNTKQAQKAAELRPLTKHLGLSLGDRCCLALAISLDATAVTADRQWKKIKFCQVDSIR